MAQPLTGILSATGTNRWVSAGLAVLAGVTAVSGLVVVIAAGFALSFDSVRAVGRASNLRGDLAWLLPAAVDGAMTIGTVTVVVMRRMGRSTAYPWTVVLANAGFSVVGNALHAQTAETLHLSVSITMVVSAVPAVNLAMSVHLLVILAESISSKTQAEAQPDDPYPGSPASGRSLQLAAWQWAEERRQTTGTVPSGQEIGLRFRRSARWGRIVKASGAAGRLDTA